MRLLALDAASEVCSAALQVGSDISHRRQQLKREHGPELLAMTRELLDGQGIALGDLDAIAFGCGPGSFTGLRIAAGITQGLALGAGLGVIPVSDLAMLAQGALEEHDDLGIAVCLDARMGEAFTGFYRLDTKGLAVPLQSDALLPPAAITLPDRGGPWRAVGGGWLAFPELAGRLGISADSGDAARLPDARYALPLAGAAAARGEVLDAADALPVYLREKIAWRRNGT